MAKNEFVMDNFIDNELRRIAQNIPKVENKALKNGVTHFANKLEQATPVGPPRKKDAFGPHTPYSETHMKDDVKWQKQGEGTYVAGYGTDTAWRAVFVNNGTINQRGQRFFEKTVSSELNKVRQIVEKTIKDELL